MNELSLEIEDGEFIVFVGPSGCGKTAALRMVAGLEEITGGEFRIGDRVVVFQNYALYPHMSVFDDIAFPLASQGMANKTIRTQASRPRSCSGSRST